MRRLLPILVVSLVGLTGCAGLRASPQPAAPESEPTSAASLPHQEGALALLLEPVEPRYEVGSDDVAFHLHVVNRGPEPVVFADPGACVPRVPGPDETIEIEADDGFVEIRIDTPDGASLAFRHSPLGPFGTPSVPPGGEVVQRLGWLGPEFSRVGWLGIDAPIFDSPGEYRVVVAYRNLHPIAVVNEETGYRTLPAFVGELVSTPALVTID